MYTDAAAQRMNKVSERQIQMMQQHAWSGKPHNPADFIAHVGSIAMDKALSAYRLSVAKGAEGKAFGGIGKQRGAISAQAVIGVVLFSTVQTNHRLEGCAFTFNRVHLR